ncbi:hypothetical protein SPRG_12455 [Saprolegnia parasitica CBS 223.65]|uniref:Uncharacterized protein n=1 Tax=Saprolegnia parasitica (strain CBS 223.65) TaxID=695850 RepID=A0A067C4G3_SAPPC|nr:hypothetical protein SPRG_12455 [Saprolegnia parasitica CBS 223.65]KDO21446.1 hypothetical protein SPRG_12455 [Saprolegnia parasitica CBS 223.65]|eukprot:XP_012207892.1 hypothetical protein SPRG_12455 [Saprolegnia parasitica CBS 223.65]
MDRPRGTLVQPSLDALDVLTPVAPEKLSAFLTAWATALPASSDMRRLPRFLDTASEMLVPFLAKLMALIPHERRLLGQLAQQCTTYIVDARPTRLKWMVHPDVLDGDAPWGCIRKVPDRAACA